MYEQTDVTELPKPSRETKFPGVNGDREISVFPVQLTTSRIGNLTRLILVLFPILYDVMTIQGKKRQCFPFR